jgi:hypothetical protein
MTTRVFAKTWAVRRQRANIAVGTSIAAKVEALRGGHRGTALELLDQLALETLVHASRWHRAVPDTGA